MEAVKIEKPTGHPGIYWDLPNKDYHSGPGISKSQLDLVRKSPSLLQWVKNAPEDSEKKTALNIGDAVHARLLEPHRYTDMFATSPANAPKNTKAGKEKWEEFEASLKPGQTVISAEDARKVDLIFDSVMAHPHARWLIEADGNAEASIYWNDSETGLLCRCRPDKLLREYNWIIDVKTTADMNRFAKSVYEYRYHVQDAFYSGGFSQHFGQQPDGFIFLVASTSIECGRYPVRLFQLDTNAKEIGHRDMREDLNMVAHCESTGDWNGIESLSLPHWAA